jgi:hypothetical protein
MVILPQFTQAAAGAEREEVYPQIQDHKAAPQRQVASCLSHLHNLTAPLYQNLEMYMFVCLLKMHHAIH